MKTCTHCRPWSSVVGLLLVQSLSAQITIQETDIQKTFSANSTLKIYGDTSGLVSIGNKGGPNVYDFSSLPFRDSSSVVEYQSSTIPFLAARFDPASFVLGSSTQNIQSPVFLFTQNRLEQPASVTVFDSLQIVRYKVPHEIVFQYPATYLTSWSETGGGVGAETTFVNNVPTNVAINSSDSISFVIDGYGTLLFKGVSHQCLRAKEVYWGQSATKTFWYYTKDGITIAVGTTLDQNDTGKVISGSTICFTSAKSTSVPQLAVIPTTYSLSQNFPNPFNPSTTIRFGVPYRSLVRLLVFNVLGQHVLELVNEEVSTGYFEKVWNANVSSGLYFYRIEAISVSDPSKHFVGVRKMLLLK